MACPKLTDPDLPLKELFTHWPETVSVFIKYNMICVGCMVSPFHTVADACHEYHLNQDRFLRELLQAAQLV